MSDNQKDRRTRVTGLILVVAIAAAGVVILLLCGVIRIPSGGADGRTERNAGGFGAEAAYGGLNAGAIVAEADAAGSQAVFSEEEVVSYLRLRGFSGAFVTTSYDMNGNFTDARPAAADSDERHPYYETMYSAPTGVLWDILVIDGSIFATNEDGLVVSESETVTIYDGSANRFYTANPERLDIAFRTVKRIDSYALDNMESDT